ncbi:MAG: Bug family tripartite tricarboxylate transporter substrate binding protein, partial [Burkholderiales bacterium]
MKLFTGIALALLAGTAPAQDAYPSKPIRVLVGYAAGGGNDIIVRVMQPELQKGLGQPVIVENKPGAQGIIAADLAAKATPDGYTIMMGPSGPMTINPATYSKLPYSPTRDFTPISMICEFPLLVTVSAASPIRSLKDLIAYARANPGKSNYASSAGIFQITTEMFKQRTGTAIEMIPYKSSGESVQAVVAGQVLMTITDPAPATGALKAGTLRGLAVTSGRRHPSWPDLP